jgi:hypothetical protein
VRLATLRPPEGYRDVLSYRIIVQKCNRRKHFKYKQTCLKASDYEPSLPVRIATRVQVRE